jgi:hypothetical protein
MGGAACHDKAQQMGNHDILTKCLLGLDLYLPLGFSESMRLAT